jgi:hypothetical protein
VTAAPTPAPAVVTLHLWGVPGPAVPGAVARMALDRPLMRRSRARFWKLLGTGAGRTFTPRDADPRHWGLLAAWDSAEDAEAFEAAATVRAWGRLAEERLRVAMRPLASRGRWSGREPFGAPRPSRSDAAGPVASITRARLRLLRSASFHHAVPPVSADLREAPGLRLALGIGEAPVGLQGTFSLWSDGEALQRFAHQRAAHTEVVARTAREGWYAEELFARFAVLDVRGSYAGRRP